MSPPQIRASVAVGSTTGRARDKIWTDADELAFLEKAPAHLHLPLLLGLWTGQREGDLRCLPWNAYDGKHIRLRQSKTGMRVMIPVGTPLKAALDTTKRQSTVIFSHTSNRDPALAESAIRKLEARTKIPDRAPDCA